VVGGKVNTVKQLSKREVNSMLNDNNYYYYHYILVCTEYVQYTK